MTLLPQFFSFAMNTAGELVQIHCQTNAQFPRIRIVSLRMTNVIRVDRVTCTAAD